MWTGSGLSGLAGFIDLIQYLVKGGGWLRCVEVAIPLIVFFPSDLKSPV